MLRKGRAVHQDTTEGAPAAPSDRKVWEGLRAGQEAAFTTLFLRYSNAVYHFARRMLASPSLAEETTQLTFAHLWRRARQGRLDPLERDTALPLLLWLARHQALSLLRSTQRRTRLVRKIANQRPPATDNISTWTAQEASRATVHDVLRRLPRHQREVVELVVFGDLDLAGCGHVLNIPLGTVKSRLSRARKALASTDVAALLSGSTWQEHRDSNVSRRA